MKLLLRAAAVLAVTSGCGLFEFDTSQPIPEQMVKGSPLGTLPLPLTLFQFPLQIDFEQATKAQNTGPASAAYLKAITLTVTSPPGGSLGFLESLTISIGAQGMPDVVVAQLMPVPNESTISLGIVPGVDLLPYAKQGAVMKASAKGSAPARDVSFNGLVVVTIKV